MRILITGAGGFSGKAMHDHLSRDPANEIFCTDVPELDLSDRDAAVRRIGEIQPEKIYHLAGSMSNDFESDYRNNVGLTANVLKGVMALDRKPRVLLIGSAAEYGAVDVRDNPIREDQPLHPVSLYGLSKVFQTELMQFHVRLYGLDIVMARTFNLFGRGISPMLFVGRLNVMIEAYKKGEISRIQLGNLQNKRDYIDVKDAAVAYEKIMERGSTGCVYNVGSGYSIRIRDLLERILAENGLEPGIIEERQQNDPDKFDVKDIYADISMLKGLG